uniref:Uncharacterized protein n=1 Tax=Salix viminalis TaxID=40686 RepID=A0A6N2NI04_SALVM
MVAHPSQVGGDRETATTAGQEEDPRALDHIIKSLGRQISQDVVVDHLIWSDWTSPPTTQSGLTGRHHRSLDWSDSADPSTFLGCVCHNLISGAAAPFHSLHSVFPARPLSPHGLTPFLSLAVSSSHQQPSPIRVSSPLHPSVASSSVSTASSPSILAVPSMLSSLAVGGQLLYVDGLPSLHPHNLHQRPPPASQLCPLHRPATKVVLCLQHHDRPPSSPPQCFSPSRLSLLSCSNYHPKEEEQIWREERPSCHCWCWRVGVFMFSSVAGHREGRYRREKKGERLIYTPCLGSSSAVVRCSTRCQWLWRMN